MPAVIDGKNNFQYVLAGEVRAVARSSTTLVVGFADETVLNIRPDYVW